jgi:bacterial/archaeal transporter family-2 protein
MEALAIPFLLFVGSLLALQAAANVQLSAAVGSPAGGATLQLAIGAGALLVAAALAGTLAAFDLLADARAWHLAGGFASAIYISAGIVLFPRLGAVVTVGLFIAGQMLASLLIDSLGWLGVDREALDAAAALGTIAVMAGAAMIVRGQGAGRAARATAVRTSAGLPALALVAGAVLPVQGAINAQLRADLDAPMTAALWSFIVATAAMALVLAAFLAVGKAPPPRAAALDRMPWWGWLGGLCGATYVTSVFLLIPEIGVAPTVALTVGGQQIASVFVDRYGWLRLPRRAISGLRLAGVALLLAGVVLIQVA